MSDIEARTEGRVEDEELNDINLKKTDSNGKEKNKEQWRKVKRKRKSRDEEKEKIPRRK